MEKKEKYVHFLRFCKKISHSGELCGSMEHLSENTAGKTGGINIKKDVLSEGRSLPDNRQSRVR